MCAMLGRYLAKSLIGSAAIVFSIAAAGRAQEIMTPTNMVLERLSVGGVLRKHIQLEGFKQHRDSPASTRFYDYSHPTPTTYLRVVLEEVRLREGQTITISSLFHDAPVDRIDGPVGGESGLTYFSSIIPGFKARVTVTGESLEGATVTVSDIAFQSSPGEVKSIFGADDRQDFAEFAADPVIQQIGDAVAFLSILGNGNVPRTCTGFLINSRQLLTNHHCYLDLTHDCDKTAVMFGYEHAIPEGVQFRCVNVIPEPGIVDGAYMLDYALVELDRPAPEAITPIALHTPDTMAVPQPERPHVPLQPLARVDAVMVHHPAGEKKQVTRTNCSVFRERVEGANGADDFRHRCDTLKGSSGSPIITLETDPYGNVEYCVAGLHHAAFANSGPFANYNRAVNMPLIAKKLAENGIQFNTCKSHSLRSLE